MSKYETLDYKIVLEDQDIEIREYSNFLIVEYEDVNDPEIKEGFRSLFTYISDDNKDNKKISMTTPVIQEVTPKMKKIAFVVPKKFGDYAPLPNNPNLKVSKFEKGLFAVIRYSGFSSDAKESKKKKKLETWILENKYERQSNYMLASYNAPFSLPMLRRNEIWVRVNKN